MFLWIVLFANYVSIARIVAFLDNESFRKEVTFSNFLCPLATMNLGQQSRVTKCASFCMQAMTCRSFFYNKQEQLCKGAPEILTSTTGCDSLPGTIYFHTTEMTNTSTTSTTTTTTPLSQFGQTCTSNADCTMTYGMCLQNACSCLSGYSYNPSTDSCVTSCGTYGSTYIEYLNLELAVFHVAEYYSVSLAQCQAYCSGLSTCRGVNYSPTFSMCRVKTIIGPDAFVQFIGVNFYTRNCA